MMTTPLPPNEFIATPPATVTSPVTTRPVVTRPVVLRPVATRPVDAARVNSDTRFHLDVERFMLDIEPPPLFLQRANR